MTEIWTIVPSISNYLVSDLGRVKGPNGRVLKPSLHKRTRRYVLRPWIRGHGRKNVRVASLVAEGFLGSRPPNTEINHKDGNALNNVLQNLEYVTHSENMRHAKLLGLMASGDRHMMRTHPEFIRYGSRCNFSKLTKEAVVEIRRRYVCGELQKSLAREFGIGQSNISMIVNLKSWRRP